MDTGPDPRVGIYRVEADLPKVAKGVKVVKQRCSSMAVAVFKVVANASGLR